MSCVIGIPTLSSECLAFDLKNVGILLSEDNIANRLIGTETSILRGWSTLSISEPAMKFVEISNGLASIERFKLRPPRRCPFCVPKKKAEKGKQKWKANRADISTHTKSSKFREVYEKEGLGNGGVQSNICSY